MLELLTTINILESISVMCFIAVVIFAMKNWEKLFSDKYIETLDLNGKLNNAKFCLKSIYLGLRRKNYCVFGVMPTNLLKNTT